MRIAICPGSFDPVTNGHLDIVKRAAKLFDHVIILVLSNPDKNTSFTMEERVALLRRVTGCMENVEVDSYGGLTADYAREKGACALVKGLRAVSDFEYEFQMALTNKLLFPELETLFLNTNAEYMYLSSSIVKQIAQYNGDISRFIPEEIREDIENRLSMEAKYHGD